jgi:hypothetical protein
MTFKVKKCFRWTLITAALLAVIAWVMSDGGHHQRYRQLGEGNRGFQSGNWIIQQTHLHNQFHQPGFHMLGFLLAILVWGTVIVSVISYIRRRAAKRCSKLSTLESVSIQDATQPSSVNGEFLDEWEKNINHLKEDHPHGNL